METKMDASFGVNTFLKRIQVKEVCGFVEMKEKVWRKVWLNLQNNEELNFYNSNKVNFMIHLICLCK